MQMCKILWLSLFVSQATIAYVPPGQSPLYYKIGGGDDYVLPATSSVHTIPLALGMRGNLNHNCGRLNPKHTLTNTLNNLRDTVHSVQGNIVNNAKSAIGHLPMYALQRAEPGLYDMLTKHVFGAYDQFKVSARACGEMEALTAQGKNPYENWLTASTRSGWQHKISLLSSGEVDANKIKHDIDQNQGDIGVEWVGGAMRGGKDQNPIYIIQDTAIAGYNALIGKNRTEVDESPPGREFASEPMVKFWQRPKECSKWIVQVVGEREIQTKRQARTTSKPGFGLLPDQQKFAKDAIEKLTKLVRQHEAPSRDNLRAVSAPGVEVTMEAIQAISEKDQDMQAVLIRRLAHDIAIAQVTERAFLAKRVLIAGSNVPNIRKSEPAQAEITRAVNYIDSEINDMLIMSKIRTQLISSTLSEILLDRAQVHANAAAISDAFKQTNSNKIEFGAISKK